MLCNDGHAAAVHTGKMRDDLSGKASTKLQVAFGTDDNWQQQHPTPTPHYLMVDYSSTTYFNH
ncbi:MAG: hypothetical protein GX945_06680 [Lentisphaerae bacterium]|nr:hypothetical protein [Lentisphaerota bacterium]